MENILQHGPESLKSLEVWEPTFQHKIKLVQDALTKHQESVYDEIYGFSRVVKGRRLVRVGVAPLGQKTGLCYSTIQRAINRLMDLGILVMLEREQPWTSTPRLFLIRTFAEVLRIWRSLGGLFVRRNRGRQIVRATGEPVEMKRPPLLELVRKIIGKVHDFLGGAPAPAPQVPDQAALQKELRESQERDRQSREADLIAKQERLARGVAIHKRLDLIAVLMNGLTRGSPEWEALHKESQELISQL